MTSDARGEAAADWHALAHEALLDHVNRGDARHALKMLLAALSRQLRRPCRLRAEQADGTLRWQLDASPGLGSDAMDPAIRAQCSRSRCRAWAGTWARCSCWVPRPPGTTRRAGRQLEPVRASAAALLLNDASAAQPPRVPATSR